MNGRRRPDWWEYALELARVASVRSEDPYVQVGAVILREDNSVASVGYNGPPAGVEVDWSDRDGRRPKIIHAEMNALRYLRPGEGTLLAVTLLPCGECLKNIASYGIRQVVFAEEYTNPQVYDKETTYAVALEFGVVLTHLLERSAD